ncbi:MAG: hypothetical protein LBG21_03315 [Campylobacteraceae bacterium]|jgi:hypothetical protein|nr:hypothetical protein [Campylobacteraceae bacterium]
MNDMFNDLKELKQKLKLESKQNIKKNQQDTKNTTTLNTNSKEDRLKAEFKEFMEKADI